MVTVGIHGTIVYDSRTPPYSVHTRLHRGFHDSTVEMLMSWLAIGLASGLADLIDREGCPK